MKRPSKKLIDEFGRALGYAVAPEDDWEIFVCESCGIRTTRLKGTFDFPICAECRAWDEMDPSGKLKRERQRKCD